jgi:hypothetical protein
MDTKGEGALWWIRKGKEPSDGKERGESPLMDKKGERAL